MKIGLLTVHRAYNYGSVLQCYALQEYLEQKGHEVMVIDYRQRWTEAVYKPFSWYYIFYYLRKKDIHAIVGYWRERKKRYEEVKKQAHNFLGFSKRLHLTSPCRNRIPQDFDQYIIGSDQLWSHQCVGGEDKVFLGNFKRPKLSRLLGYAISAGTNSLQLFGKEKTARILSRFDALSMREKSNAEYIERTLGACLPVCIDPTLLVDASLWQNMINASWASKKYIAVYQVRHIAGQSDFLRKKAEVLAKQLECEVIDLSAMQYSVEDYISIIKYARYVFTSSFHATVFSVIMETPCFALRLNDGLDVRYVDLLSNIGLEKELVDVDFTPLPFKVDFVEAKKKLRSYVKTSEEFLNRHLKLL